MDLLYVKHYFKLSRENHFIFPGGTGRALIRFGNLRYFRLYYRCLCCNSNQKAVQQYWCERNCEKVAIFLMISVAHVADQYLVESTDVLRSVTTLFYLSNEGISIFENVCKIGLPLPGRLKNLLEKFKDIKNQAE